MANDISAANSPSLASEEITLKMGNKASFQFRASLSKSRGLPPFLGVKVVVFSSENPLNEVI